MLTIAQDAPARLKRELDTVLSLQADLDDIQKYVKTVQANIAKEDVNPEAQHFLNSLQQSHSRTIDQVEKLYASLNVPDDFPELQGLSLPFVRTLIMARDLKINIRKTCSRYCIAKLIHQTQRLIKTTLLLFIS